MRKLVLILLALTAVTALGGTQSVRQLMIMSLDFDPNDPNATRISYRMAQDSDVDDWYATFIAPRVAQQVQAMLSDPNSLYPVIQPRVQAEIAQSVVTPDPNSVVDPNELAQAITASEQRDWQRFTQADQNWAHLLEQTMLQRAVTEFQKRLTELAP